MRFSITTASLTIASLVIGSSADFASNPAYIPTWGVQGDSHGVLGRGAPPLLLDNGEIYMAPSTNNIVDPELRFQLVGVANAFGPLTAAKLVEYPGYSTNDQGFYMSQPVGGSLVYSTFNINSEGLGPWWLKTGPSNDPQFRLTLNGSAAAKVLWDSSKNRYKVYVGSDIPTNITGMVDIELKVTQYCGPGYTYCL